MTTTKKVVSKSDPKKSTKATPKKAGVISTIVDCVTKSGKKGITKDGILKVLVKNFPDREEAKMKVTVGVQVPSRISKEKFKIERLENGNYRKA